MNDCLPPSNEDRMDEHGLLTTFQNVRVSLFCTLKKEHLEQRHLSSTCPSLYYMESAPKENFLRDSTAAFAKASENFQGDSLTLRGGARKLAIPNSGGKSWKQTVPLAPSRGWSETGTWTRGAMLTQHEKSSSGLGCHLDGLEINCQPLGQGSLVLRLLP